MNSLASSDPLKEDQLLKIILSDERKTKVLKELRGFLMNLEKEKLSEYGKAITTNVEKLIDSHFIFENNLDKTLIFLHDPNQKLNEHLLSLAPNLTSSDLKLCNLVALNLSNLEIGDILGIEPSSVSVKKYRIKKKLGIGNIELLNFVLRLK